jgi:HK97 gp10 family phage protein
MADWDVKATGFKELSEKLLSLANGEAADRIQRSALNAAGTVIMEGLELVTPVRTSPVYGNALPEGALKEALRKRVIIPKDGEAPEVDVDFGNLSWIAHIVDIGHVNANAKTGRKHTPAHPFIRGAEESTRAEATDVYLSTLQAGIDKELSK